MQSNKLDQLKEKIFSGTNPKLFVPLSDEYKSRGMTADAIHVLEKCIEKFPKYMSARVALGNLYMEKGCFIHAIEEFGEVANVIPNNVLSHRKLAELYAAIGETQNALLAYKTVLSIKPSDEDAEAGIQKILNEMQPERKASQETATEEQVCFDTHISAADTSDELLGETDEIIQDETISIGNAEDEPYFITEVDAPPAQIDFMDEYELPPDTDFIDTDDNEETIELTPEPSNDDTISIGNAEDEPYFITEVDAPPAQIESMDEYELSLDIAGAADTYDAGETVQLTVEPSNDDTIAIETAAAVVDEPVFEIEEAAPPAAFNPVHEYELPPDIDIDDTEDIEETLELTSEPSNDDTITIDAMAEAAAANDFGIEEATTPTDDYKPDSTAVIVTEDIEETLELTSEPSNDDTITIDAMAEAAAANDFGIEEATAPTDDYKPDSTAVIDTEYRVETLALVVEPSTDETTPDDTIAAVVAEPDFKTEEDEAAARFNPMADYELPFDIASILGLDDVEEMVVLKAEPLTGEIIPIDAIAATETEPDFGIDETAPPPPFNPEDEYSTPSDMDIIDSIDIDHVTAELPPKHIASLTVSIGTLAAAMAEPNFGIVETTYPIHFNPVDEYYIPPDIDNDNGKVTTELPPKPIASITVSIGTLAATMAEPNFGIIEATPPIHFNPVDEYYMPPDIDTDNGSANTELTSEPLINEISHDDISLIDTINDAAAVTAPDLEIDEAAPSIHSHPVEEYYMPPDTDNGSANTELSAEPLINEISHDEISLIDTINDAVTMAEPDLEIGDAAPSIHFNPVEEYYLPPDIDTDNGSSNTELTAEPLINDIALYEISLIDTLNDAAAVAKHDLKIDEAAPPIHFHPVEDYYMNPDIDNDNGSANTELSAEPLSNEITHDEISLIDTLNDAAAETAPDFEIVEAAPPIHFHPVEEYYMNPDIDIDSGNVNTELSAEPLSNEITHDEISLIDTINYVAAETEPDLEIVEAAPPIHFHPVEKYYLPPDIDSGSVTTELTAEPLSNEITHDEISLIDTINYAAAETEPDVEIVEAAPRVNINPVEEYYMPPDIVGIISKANSEKTLELTLEPFTPEITTIDTVEETAAEPYFRADSGAPPFIYNRIELPPDIVNENEIITAEPLAVEATPIDIINDIMSGMITETEQAFGIEDARPPALYSPVDEYDLPPDIDIDDAQLKEEILAGGITPDGTPVPTEIEPDIRIEKALSPTQEHPVDEYELPPDIDDTQLRYEILARGIAPDDMPLPTENEPDIRIEDALPPTQEHSMGEYELPPDIDDARLREEILAGGIAPDGTPVPTGTEPDIRIEDALSPTQVHSVDEYELPPDIDDAQLREEILTGEIAPDGTPVPTGTEPDIRIADALSPTQEHPVDEYDLPMDIVDYGEDTTIERTFELKEEHLTEEIQHSVQSEITGHEQKIIKPKEMLPEKEDAGIEKAEQPAVQKTKPRVDVLSGEELDNQEIADSAPLPSDIDKADKPFSQNTKTIKNMISKRVEGKVKAETIDSSRVWLMQELDMIDSFIITEHYLAAIKAFQRLLERYPGDEEILKRIDDIRRIAKLMDRDDNTMIRKLRYIKDKLRERKE